MTVEAKLAELQRRRNSLDIFGRDCLKVRTKAGSIEPFVMNDAQRFVHEAIEKQRAEMGWVRALILKGRQQGISTYTAARFYWVCSMRKGVNVYILAHEQPASDNLFKIVDRYHINNPLRPSVGISNAKELIFDKLDSSYVVATAGTKAGGRSRTISLFHGSEVAYWQNAPDHFSASVQGVPLEPGTEIILESTSAGAGGEFYERCLDAEAGRGDYILIFLPWWLSKEYARPIPAGFKLSDDAEDGMMSEVEYAATYNLSLEQMHWRREKIRELRSEETFQREYPATPAEAWTAEKGHEPFISSLPVLRARKREKVPAVGPLIVGVDPASNGGDRFSVAWRRGQSCTKIEYRNKIDIIEAVEWLTKIIDQDNPVRMNIDSGNIGAAIVTLLKAKGPKYADVVRGVNFGATSQAKLAFPERPGPKNVRAEIWQRMGEWIGDKNMPAIIPDIDMLQTDITAPRLKPATNNDFVLESKQEMKKRQVRSPDLADSLALTFTFKEFFKGYQETDGVAPTYGNPEGLQRAPKPAYSPPPPVTGNTGWMG